MSRELLNIEDIAKVCHNVNMRYCEALGDKSQVKWEDAPEWQKYSAMDGVQFHLKNPDVTAEDSHNNWLAEKIKNGWKYGPIKDAEKKEHPSCIPYDKLLTSEKVKDILFKEVVESLRDKIV